MAEGEGEISSLNNSIGNETKAGAAAGVVDVAKSVVGTTVEEIKKGVADDFGIQPEQRPPQKVVIETNPVVRVGNSGINEGQKPQAMSTKVDTTPAVTNSNPSDSTK